MKNQRRYKAFSLIELLVAIVILGIIMTTIPLFLQTLVSSSKVTNKEEVFFSQFSLLSLINTRYFDENNTKGFNFYKDLNATGGDSELLNNYSSNFAGKTSRLGKTQIENNLYRSGSKDSVSNIGIDLGEINNSTITYDDIDDFNGYGEHIAYGVQSGGYDINVSVKYLSDDTNYSNNDINFDFNFSSVANLTNIKLIKLTTKLKDGTTIVLTYPTCNIGASKMYSFEEITR
ncbi:type II secretion system protein [Caminibacter mediatlanticus TB-2]|uniref:Type II secretion system protein n=1 Tax=Caminibacter mediatlanticus TB-2 TaxID=391592 RepID=A0ABX5V9C3_9BACT|nr:type II secretion system protein [Caminibacter mediatlanticus]QCT94892.1 type II secretion system protein [Caminibacter mediatlanticus TB-2]